MAFVGTAALQNAIVDSKRTHRASTEQYTGRVHRADDDGYRLKWQLSQARGQHLDIENNLLKYRIRMLTESNTRLEQHFITIASKPGVVADVVKEEYTAANDELRQRLITADTELNAVCESNRTQIDVYEYELKTLREDSLSYEKQVRKECDELLDNRHDRIIELERQVADTNRTTSDTVATSSHKNTVQNVLEMLHPQLEKSLQDNMAILVSMTIKYIKEVYQAGSTTIIKSTVLDGVNRTIAEEKTHHTLHITLDNAVRSVRDHAFSRASGRMKNTATKFIDATTRLSDECAKNMSTAALFGANALETMIVNKDGKGEQTVRELCKSGVTTAENNLETATTDLSNSVEGTARTVATTNLLQCRVVLRREEACQTTIQTIKLIVPELYVGMKQHITSSSKPAVTNPDTTNTGLTSDEQYNVQIMFGRCALTTIELYDLYLNPPKAEKTEDGIKRVLDRTQQHAAPGGQRELDYTNTMCTVLQSNVVHDKMARRSRVIKDALREQPNPEEDYATSLTRTIDTVLENYINLLKIDNGAEFVDEQDAVIKQNRENITKYEKTLKTTDDIRQLQELTAINIAIIKYGNSTRSVRSSMFEEKFGEHWDLLTMKSVKAFQDTLDAKIVKISDLEAVNNAPVVLTSHLITIKQRIDNQFSLMTAIKGGPRELVTENDYKEVEKYLTKEIKHVDEEQRHITDINRYIAAKYELVMARMVALSPAPPSISTGASTIAATFTSLDQSMYDDVGAKTYHTAHTLL
jgi:hypothetical protein